VINFTPRPLYLPEKELPHYPLDRKLVPSQSQSGRDVETTAFLIIKFVDDKTNFIWKRHSASL
jgi:hypothetical protein